MSKKELDRIFEDVGGDDGDDGGDMDLDGDHKKGKGKALDDDDDDDGGDIIFEDDWIDDDAAGALGYGKRAGKDGSSKSRKNGGLDDDGDGGVREMGALNLSSLSIPSFSCCLTQETLVLVSPLDSERDQSPTALPARVHALPLPLALFILNSYKYPETIHGI